MYSIKKIGRKINGICDELWNKAEIAEIKTVNWKSFEYAPHTTAKLLYDDYGIYVQFKTDETPLLARERKQNGSVCRDSCVELFISPNSEDKRYFNFEFNPFGTMYFGFRSSRDDFVHLEKDKSYFEVKTYVNDKEWLLQFAIPFEIINEAFGGHTKEMSGNLYKCGEDTEKAHYVTYYPIKTDTPDFHRPEYFGKFILD